MRSSHSLLVRRSPISSGPFTIKVRHGLARSPCDDGELTLFNITGFDDVLGLSPDDTPDLAVGPSTYLSNPCLITVTSGPSCYSFEKGYLINSRESFVSFFNASIAQPKPIKVTQTNDDLEIDGGKLRISFHRTLRVPETRGTHDLPANLGKFPLFNVANYASRMPGDMAQKGGIFLPLYQREAMYIGFDSTSWGLAPQYAIKVFVGGVNAISGKTWDQKSDKQDYIVVPPQRWLDGIATAPGVVKQFVAMPLGSGYSVEKQVTGKEDTGGMQIEIVPAYNNGAGIASMLAFSGQPMPFSAARLIDPMRSPRDNGYEPGARLYMKDYRDPYVWGRPASGHPVYSRVDRIFTYDLPSAMDQDKNNQYITRGYGKPKERPAILRDLLDLSSQRPRPGIPFRIKVSHMLTIIVQHDGSLEHPIEDTFKIKCSPFAHVGQLEDAINKLINKKPALRNAEYVMKYNGMVLYRHDRTLWEHGMRDTVTVQYLCPSAVSRQQPAEVPGQTVTSRPRGLPYPSAHSLELPRSYVYGQPQSPLGPIEDSPSGVSQQHNCSWEPPPPVNERSCSWGPPPPVTERSCSWGPPSPVNEGSSRGQVISLSEGKLRERDFVPQNSKPESRGGPPTPVFATAPAFTPKMRPRMSPDSRPKRKAPGKGDVDFSGRGPVMHQFRRIKLAFDAATGEGGKTPLDDVPMMAEPAWSAQSSPPVTTVATAGLPSTSWEPTPRLFFKKSRSEPLPPENSPPSPVAPDWTSGGSVFYDMEQKEFPLPRNSAQPTPAPNWDMGIAAGGQILQYIQPDTRSRREWNLTLARVLNIQILNSVAFEACTGMLTPQTPIDTGSYNKAGLPFFRIYEEGEATVGGGFDVEIETVGQIDADKGVKMGVSVDPNNPTACVSCRVNLCDSMYDSGPLSFFLQSSC